MENELSLKRFIIKRVVYLIGIISFVIILFSEFVPEAKTVEEIIGMTPRIESISYKTFEDVSLRYNLLNDDSVIISYKTNGDIEEVYEKGIDQKYSVVKDDSLSDEEFHEELNVYDSSKKFFRDETSRRFDRLFGLLASSVFTAVIMMIYLSFSIDEYVNKVYN